MIVRFRRPPPTHEIVPGAISTCFFAAFLILFTPSVRGQTNFESRQSGVWNSSQTWTLVSGTDSDTIPDANDNVTILGGHTVTAGTANRNCANLTVNAGGTLSVENSGSVRVNANPGSATVNGTVLLGSSGTLMETGGGTRTFLLGSGGTLTISSTAAFPAFDTYSFDPASTVAFTAGANQNVQSGIAYGHVILGGSGRKTVAPIPADSVFLCNGQVTVGAGTTLDVSSNILSVHFNGDVEINGTLDASVGTVVVEMRGTHWTNNGTYLRSVTAGFGLQPIITFFNTQIGGTTAVQKFYDVCFQGDATALASIDSARNVEIKPGATFRGAPSQVYAMTGNWTNNGGYIGGGATVSFIGTSNQNVTGTTFANLVVNNPAGITMTGDVTVSAAGTLTLLNGNVTTGTHTLRIDNPSPAAIVLGSNKIAGRMTRAIQSGSTETYRFLSTNATVTPGGTGNPTSISMAEFPHTNPPNLAPAADTNRIVKRYYTISQIGEGSGFTYTMRLPYMNTEVRGNEILYTLFRNDGTGWINMGSAIVDTVNNFVEQSGLTGFSDWAIAEGDVTLPIQLSHFTGTLVAGTRTVHLVWGTLSETNNYGFIVQRSGESRNHYTDLPNSFVPGHGTTLEPHEYSWTDVDAQEGTSYYRLKQMDLDGTPHFTDGIRIDVPSITEADENVPAPFQLGRNYPNPFNPSTTIEFSVDRGGFTTLLIYNLTGQRMATLFSGVAAPGRRYVAQFEGSGLSNGTYFAKLTSGNKTAVQKLVLLK